MKIINKALKFIIFLIFGILIFQVLTYIFVPKWTDQEDPATGRIRGYYKEDTNTIDVLAIGASSVGKGYSPIEVWNKYGITSYNLGTSNQTMSFAYYLIKEAINYQSIKVVVLDMDTIFSETNAPEGEYRKLFDNMKLGKVKIEAINDKNLKIEDKDKLSYVFPLLRFHTRFQDIKNIDFKYLLNDENENLSYKGMAITVGVKPYIDNERYMEEKNDEGPVISDENLYYTNEIIKLCKDENIKLIFMTIPSATSGPIGKQVLDWSLNKNRQVEELANKNEIEFIDFNLPGIQKEIGFDWLKDSSDCGNHLNVYGAEKVSNYIGKILSEEYNVPDHRNDKEISNNWNEIAKKYQERKTKMEKKLADNKK